MGKFWLERPLFLTLVVPVYGALVGFGLPLCDLSVVEMRRRSLGDIKQFVQDTYLVNA